VGPIFEAHAKLGSWARWYPRTMCPHIMLHISMVAMAAGLAQPVKVVNLEPASHRPHPAVGDAVAIPSMLLDAVVAFWGAISFNASQDEMRTAYAEYDEAHAHFASNEAAFSTFRSSAFAVAMYEHVSPVHGEAILALIRRTSPSLLRVASVARFAEGAAIGSPRRAAFPGLPAMSPTSLRYVKVVAELQQCFGSLGGMRIVEVGPGYGGQAHAILSYARPKLYHLVDLPGVTALAHKFIKRAVGCTWGTTEMRDVLHGYSQHGFDLFISNYAFHELRLETQMQYFRKLVRNSSHGYVIYSEGLSAHSARQSLRTGTLLWLLEAVGLDPGTMQEEPLSGVHEGLPNTVITWGGSRCARENRHAVRRVEVWLKHKMEHLAIGCSKESDWQLRFHRVAQRLIRQHDPFSECGVVTVLDVDGSEITECDQVDHADRLVLSCNSSIA